MIMTVLAWGALHLQARQNFEKREPEQQAPVVHDLKQQYT